MTIVGSGGQVISNSISGPISRRSIVSMPPTTSPSANSCGRVAWRRLKASSCRVRPAPRSTDCLISATSPRAGSSRPSSISSRSAEPMMLIRMLLKSCATPPASRPMASSFCDCRSCSSRARRSVMSRTKPVITDRAVRPDARDRHFDRELGAVGAQADQSRAGGRASGPPPVVMYWLSAALARLDPPAAAAARRSGRGCRSARARTSARRPD